MGRGRGFRVRDAAGGEGADSSSGLLQEGYVVGYLLAALVYGTLFSSSAGAGMFVIGAMPAFLVIYIRTKVHESPAWIRSRSGRAEKRV